MRQANSLVNAGTCLLAVVIDKHFVNEERKPRAKEALFPNPLEWGAYGGRPSAPQESAVNTMSPFEVRTVIVSPPRPCPT